MSSDTGRPRERSGRKLDPFTIVMMGAVACAALLPAAGRVARDLDGLGTAAIALLFFGHGAVLSFGATLAGLRQWRLHLLVFATTFVVFPLVIRLLAVLPTALLPADLYLGFLYLAALPSAVSGSIAFTAMAGGNVPAAICASATSNTLGLMVTPFIVAATMRTQTGGFDLVHALREVAVELLLPFALGQIVHPRVRPLAERHGHLLRFYDQSVIALVIYTAFSQFVTGGLWRRLPLATLLGAIAICAALMIVVVLFERTIARRLGFSRGDEIAAVFCGSKKSLASGLPLAKLLFGQSPSFGMIIVPIMLYNQVQILIGAVLAERYASEPRSGAAPAAARTPARSRT